MNKTIRRPDTKQTINEPTDSAVDQSASMETIRDLLFGVQQKQNDARLTALSSELDRLEQLFLTQAQEHKAQLRSLETRLLQGKQQDLNDMGEAILAMGHSIKRLGVAE